MSVNVYVVTRERTEFSVLFGTVDVIRRAIRVGVFTCVREYAASYEPPSHLLLFASTLRRAICVTISFLFAGTLRRAIYDHYYGEIIKAVIVEKKNIVIVT